MSRSSLLALALVAGVSPALAGQPSAGGDALLLLDDHNHLTEGGRITGTVGSTAFEATDDGAAPDFKAEDGMYTVILPVTSGEQTITLTSGSTKWTGSADMTGISVVAKTPMVQQLEAGGKLQAPSSGEPPPDGAPPGGAPPGGAGAGMTPGSMTPGSMTPGSMTPGSMTPGGMAPGGMSAAPGAAARQTILAPWTASEAPAPSTQKLTVEAAPQQRDSPAPPIGVTIGLTLVALATFGGVGFWIFRKPEEKAAEADAVPPALKPDETTDEKP
ncbi:MAG: hypothetical protein EXR69_11165 [Myxococcales bacterium]|nr:hypothetical protein [Myxococcales bacterium]